MKVVSYRVIGNSVYAIHADGTVTRVR